MYQKTCRIGLTNSKIDGINCSVVEVEERRVNDNDSEIDIDGKTLLQKSIINGNSLETNASSLLSNYEE